MSWLKLVRPKISTKQKHEVPDSVWQKCPSCGQMLFHRDLIESHQVCDNCNHHLRLGIAERFAVLFDNADTLTNIAVKAPAEDPLKFKDSKKYIDRLKATRKKKQDQEDAFKLVKGEIDGVETVVMAMDFSFMGGSMGTYVGEAIVTGAEYAAEHNLPYLLISQSGGARMQEGILSLMQMARTTAALQELKEKALPYIVLLTDPTTGGVTASFAMLGDVLVSEPGALIGFAGPRVIEQTIRETLPEGFQTAEYLLEHGMLDLILERKNQRQELGRILKNLMNRS